MRWLVLAGILVGSPAAADVLPPQRVTTTVHGTRVTFVVRVRVAFDGEAYPAATADVGVPDGGIVTRASAFVGGVEHRLALTETAAANDAFDRIGSAFGDDKPWGVLVTGGGDDAQIQIAAPVGGAAEIELEIDAPTCFANDARWVHVPESWSAAVHAAAAAAPMTSATAASGPWLAFPSAMPRDIRIGTLGERLTLPSGDFARVEIDLARELEDVPHDLATAIVVDASRSVTPAEREVQRAIVASYLARAPHSYVQVIGYARRAKALLPSWAVTEVAAARIDRELRAIRGANGSNVDIGIAEAGGWLGRIGGTRRVIVLTDERVAQRIAEQDPADWAALLPAGTVVHVVALRDSAGPLVRDDDVQFGALAKTTGGIGAEATRGGDAMMLVRPISLDSVAFEGAGWTAESASCEDSLAAGASCAWLAKGPASAGPVTMAGLLWNRKVTRVVVPEAARGRELARTLSVAGVIGEDTQLEVDRAAQAVNAVWSLWARWGGTGGYAERYGVGHVSGIGGGSSSHTIVDTIGVSSRLPELDLRDQLAGPIAACGDVHPTIAIRLTLEEIVDVTVRDGGAQTSCIEDAVWNTLVAVPNAPPISIAALVL